MVAINSENPDLVTVHELAMKYRVDTSIIRSWVKSGYINYVLVGPRHLKRIRVSEAVKPLYPDPVTPVMFYPPPGPQPIVVRVEPEVAPIDNSVSESPVPVLVEYKPDPVQPPAPRVAVRKPLPPMPKKR